MWNMLKHFGLKLLHKDDSWLERQLELCCGANALIDVWICNCASFPALKSIIPTFRGYSMPCVRHLRSRNPTLDETVSSQLAASACTVSSSTSCQMCDSAAAAASATANLTNESKPANVYRFQGTESGDISFLFCLSHHVCTQSRWTF